MLAGQRAFGLRPLFAMDEPGRTGYAAMPELRGSTFSAIRGRLAAPMADSSRGIEASPQCVSPLSSVRGLSTGSEDLLAEALSASDSSRLNSSPWVRPNDWRRASRSLRTRRNGWARRAFACRGNRRAGADRGLHRSWRAYRPGLGAEHRGIDESVRCVGTPAGGRPVA